MTISPIQYPIYQQPNYFQPVAPFYPYQQGFAEKQSSVIYPMIPYPPAECPSYDINTTDSYDRDKYYSPPVYSDYVNADIRKNLLYSQNNIQGLLDFGANKQMKEIYPKIKDNTDFKELLNSRYYQNGTGFINLLDTIAYIKFKRDKKLQPVNLPANIGFNPDTTDYKKYGTEDYLRILNNFVKSDKISDDLKRYYIAKESKNLSAYYDRMDKISESNDIVSTIL